jgi:hypothetical protein
VLAAVALASVALAGAAPVKVVLAAPGHAPKVNVHLNYSVRATQGGKPVAAKLTEEIIDPIGGKHPVTYGTTKKVIKNWPFHGVFRDFIVWPAATRGLPLTWRIVVVVGSTKRTINYKVTPRA